MPAMRFLSRIKSTSSSVCHQSYIATCEYHHILQFVLSAQSIHRLAKLIINCSDAPVIINCSDACVGVSVSPSWDCNEHAQGTNELQAEAAQQRKKAKKCRTWLHKVDPTVFVSGNAACMRMETLLYIDYRRISTVSWHQCLYCVSTEHERWVEI